MLTPDIIKTGRLAELLKQHSEAFKVPFLLLDKEKEIIFKFPENTPHSELDAKPLNLRDFQVGYVAVPSGCGLSGTGFDLVAGNLSLALEMSYEVESLSGEIAKNYEELSLLWRLSSKLGAWHSANEICTVLADEVMKLCPSANVSVMLASDASAGVTLLFPEVFLGAARDKASMLTLRTDRGLMKDAAEKRVALTVCDVSQDKRFEGLPYNVTRILIVPLIVDDAVIGAIVANDKLDGEEFYSTEIKLISGIASACSVSIKKALLFEEIRNMLLSTAEAFSFAIEAKDPYTYGHSRRVSDISTSLAKKLMLPDETVTRIRLAALLHDIGKIGTPENILHKNQSLNLDELEEIKEHPVIGSRMIENVPRMKEIAQWIRHHHEKYDGTGYPLGLKGNDIPLPSRIISLSDYFDALTSDRPYRKAYDKESAIKIMKDSRGIHFDPLLLDHFEKMMDMQVG